VGSLGAPSAITTSQSGANVTVSWGAASLSTGGGVSGYFVRRSDGTAVCGSPTQVVSGVSCTDSGVPGGSYSYTVTAVYHSWDASASSASVVVLSAPALTSTPSDPSARTSPSIGFSGGGAGSYACRLDGGSFSSCTSPQLESSLASGSHTFKVHAVQGSSTGPDATYTWTIDTSTPSITATPANPSNTASPSFSFSHTEAAYTFKCQLDGATPTSCISPKTYAGVADGSHTFAVLAVAADGSQTATTSYTWLQDTTPPTDSVSLASGATGAIMAAGRVYYKGNTAGALQLTDAVTDTGSGPASATFPATATTGWTHAAETVSSGTGTAPTITYTSHTLSWAANPANPSAYTTTSKDLATNTSTGAAVTFVSDTTAPAGGALTVNGTAATPAGSTSTSAGTAFTIGSRTDYTESQSATASGLAASILTVQSETLTAGTCGAAGTGGTFTSPTTITGTTQPSGITTGYCYLYTLTGTDNVGNTATISTTVSVPTPVAVTSMIAANGLTAHKIDQGDTVTITFSGALDESTLCSGTGAWIGQGAQMISGNNQVDVTLNSNGASDNTLTVTTTSGCTFNFGSIDLGSTAYISSGSTTFGGTGNGGNKSTIAFSGGTTPTLTIKIGAGTASNAVTASTLTYNPSALIKDTNSNAVAPGSSSGQTF
jgi:hypothetical protein